MNLDTPFQGTLFVNDFPSESIVDTPDWQAIDDDALATLEASLREVFDHFPIDGSPNESQTEDDLIWLVLVQLGWTASLRQQNLSARGREDVPDGLLFPDESEKDRANGFAEEWKRYELGLAIVESKRWLRPLDRRSGRQHEETAPSTQMQRYLRRIDDLTAGKVRWGILTNGAKWRLYYQGAQSVSEEFFELDLATLLDLPNHNGGLFALSDAERHHWLKVFTLVFRCEAFLSGATDPRTFHQRAIEVGRFYEERVAASLSDLVFGQVFPKLARVIAAAAPDARLLEVRDARKDDNLPICRHRIAFIINLSLCSLTDVFHEREIVVICNCYSIKSFVSTGLDEPCCVFIPVFIGNVVCSRPPQVSRRMNLQVSTVIVSAFIHCCPSSDAPHNDAACPGPLRAALNNHSARRRGSHPRR